MTSALSDPPVRTEQFRVCSFDVDFTRRATAANLCRYFLEAAWNHAEELGLGFNDLAAQSKFWVLSRLRMELQESPAWGSIVTLRTWPRPLKAVFAMRDFEMVDAAGTRIAAGSSAWVVLDVTSKRPQRLPKLMPALAALGEHMALDRDPEKLPGAGNGQDAFSLTVRYTDIDANQHVNSSRYIAWILDACPMDFHREHVLRALEINYLGETVGGQVLSVRSRDVGSGVWDHSIVKAGADEVCRAQLEWRGRGG